MTFSFMEKKKKNVPSSNPPLLLQGSDGTLTLDVLPQMYE